MSPIAYRLYQHLRSQRDGQNLVLEELVSALHSSKTGIRAAFAELESKHYLTYEQIS